MRRRTVSRLAASLGGLLLCACNGSVGTTTVAPTPSPAGATTTPGPSDLALSDHFTATIRASIRRPDVTKLAVWADRYVSWEEQSAGTGNVSTAVVYDLATGSTVMPVHATTARATLDPVVGGGPDGHTLVYREEAAVPSDAQPSTTWKLYAFDFVTNRRDLLAASAGSTFVDDLPYPSVSNRWVVWMEPTGAPDVHGGGASGHDLYSYDLVTHQRLKLAKGAPFSSAWVDGDTVVWDQDTASGMHDVFAEPADGTSKPSAVSHSGVAFGAQVRDGYVAWVEPSLTSIKSQWMKKLDFTGSPTTTSAVEVGTFPGRGIVPGDGIAILVDLEHSSLAVTSLADASKVAPLSHGQVELGAHWDTDRSLIAWGELTTDANGHLSTTVTVLSVHAV